MEPTYFRWGSYGNEVVECGMDKATHVYLTRADFDALVAQRDGTTARDDAVEEAARAFYEAARAYVEAKVEGTPHGCTYIDVLRTHEALVAAERAAALRRAHGGPPERSDGGHEAQGRGGA